MVKNNNSKGMGSGSLGLDTDNLADALKEHKENFQEDGPGDGELEGEIITEDIDDERGQRQEEAKQKFTEKKIRNFLKAPFELWFLKTGCEKLRLSDPEVDLLLEDTVDILNAFVKVNPLWLAGIGLTINGAMLVMDKSDALKKFNAEKAARAKEHEQKRNDASSR